MIFGDQFYPTPKPVVEKMLEPYLRDGYRGKYIPRDITIIDPSAGHGAILDVCSDYCGFDYERNQRQTKREDRRVSDKLFAIEIDDNLRAILVQKGYNVIGTNFLEFADPYRFTLWLMNPPFHNGVDHLLYAWERATSGDIVCLLNANSINENGTAKQRQLYQLIDIFGSWENIGSVFKNAERPTDVDVALVRLTKPQTTDRIFISGLNHDDIIDETEFDPNALAERDPYKRLVSLYLGAAKALEEKHLAMAKVRFYTQDIDVISRHMDTHDRAKMLASGKTNDEAAEALAAKREAERQRKIAAGDEDAAKSLREEIAALKKEFWTYVFDKTNILQKASSTTAEKFRALRDDYETLSFDHHNLMALVDWIVNNEKQMQDEFILSAFSQAIGYHEKNKKHWEGWKTNSAHKLNKKTIIPYGCNVHDTYFSSAYRKRDFYDDMDKALAFLSGIPIENVHSTYIAISNRERGHDGEPDGKGGHIHVPYDAPLESTFFKIRLYKKGTVHLTFKDLKLLDRFNWEAAKAHGWQLPGGEGY